jgi:hypothetical protein
MAVNAYLWGPGSKLWPPTPSTSPTGSRTAGLFWHFVDLVWIFLVPGPLPAQGEPGRYFMHLFSERVGLALVGYEVWFLRRSRGMR